MITNMTCKPCSAFLHDFLKDGLSKELSFSKFLRKDSFKLALPEIAQSIVWMYEKIQDKAFTESLKTATNIARRGRKKIEYQQLLMSATLNLLKFRKPWLIQDINYMKILLIEKSLFKGRQAREVLTISHDFLCYVIPNSFLYLEMIHDDHKHPKGIDTDITSFIDESKEEKEDDLYTLYDHDNYQKEILEEENENGFYT